MDTIPTDQIYCETNHTLGKCGLVEFLSEQPDRDDYTIIVLKRNLAKQCASYIQRGDFGNSLMLWQWFLAPDYPNRMVASEPFVKLGSTGLAIWYTLEMDSRELYYQRVYGDRLRFIPIQLEEAVKPEGAAKLLKALGYDQEPVLPPKYNASAKPRDENLVLQIETLLANSAYDPETIVQDFLNTKRSLSLEETPLAS